MKSRTTSSSGHASVTEPTRPALPRLFAAELVDDIGVILTFNEDVDLDTPERIRVAAVQARQFADHLDTLADEQQAAADMDKAIGAAEAHLAALRAMRQRMGVSFA